MTELGHDEHELEARGGLATAREIAQQPAVLRKTHAVLLKDNTALDRFLRPLVDRAGLRVILAGAGSSAFIGECLAPHLAATLARRVEAIPTTDLVSAPRLYFEPSTPTLLVSFARSGNSPESVAAVDLAQQLVRDVHHLVITCNRGGALAVRAASAANALAITLPEEAHDRSFAMTSSVTAMMYAALTALAGVERIGTRLDSIVQAVDGVITTQRDAMKTLASKGCERVVYLGSHIFKGLAREAALKLLELTDGGVIATYDSPLGFRHGPKTIVNARTLVVIFVANDPYTRRYDLDLLREIEREGRSGGVLAICGREDGLPGGGARIVAPGVAAAADVDLLFPFVAAPQIFAFEAALARGLAPDNPNRSGTVHRVVQGVRIYPLSEA
jgi:tagatose-6-phosphate ketose/aldose isomerase